MGYRTLILLSALNLLALSTLTTGLKPLLVYPKLAVAVARCSVDLSPSGLYEMVLICFAVANSA